MAELVRKTELAHRLGVSPSRVSQWLSEGRIHGDAIVGKCRTARIDLGLARLQLAEAFEKNLRDEHHIPLGAAALPFDLETAAAFGRATSRAADRALPFLAERLAGKWGLQPQDVLRELRRAWLEYCGRPQ